MSKNQKRSVYVIELNFASGTVEHQVAPTLFRELARQHRIEPETYCRARVHPRYFAYIHHETNQIEFVLRERLLGCSVALRYYLLWLYGVKYDSQGRPIYSGLHQQCRSVYARA